MIVLVCGGRDYGLTDFQSGMIHGALSRLHKQHNFTMLIEGGALGVDAIANIWAQTHGIHVATVSALWHVLGRQAGPTRNRRMLDLGPKLVIAFPGGRGTAHMIRSAVAAGVEVIQPLAGSDPCTTTPAGPQAAPQT